jgi:hypothetical protein
MVIWCLIILFVTVSGIILNIRSNSSFPVVKQHSEEDCGAACLATIPVKRYKRDAKRPLSISISLQQIAELGEQDLNFLNF